MISETHKNVNCLYIDIHSPFFLSQTQQRTHKKYQFAFVNSGNVCQSDLLAFRYGF